MDWNLAIERNREALKRILASLVSMAGLGGQFTFFPQKVALPQDIALAEKSKLSPTLPRHLYRAVLRLLRPAEAAARRLVIVAARGLAVPPRPLQVSVNGKGHTVAKAAPLHPPLRSGGGVAEGDGGGIQRLRTLALPHLDPLRRGRPYRPTPSALPRICVPGITERFPVPPPPSPDDPISAARLTLRLAALGRALDDLPGHAKRFVRWRASRAAAGAQNGNPRKGPFHRTRPLRPGRPPGWRRRSPVHEVHEILNDTHGLAFWALEAPDSS